MRQRIKYILLFLLTWCFVHLNYAQNTVKNWDAQKIRGERQFSYPPYNGFPYLNEAWCLGKIEFTSGEVTDSIYVKYSSYKDEVIYYNKNVSSQIIIDKVTLKGFEFTDQDGLKHVFRKQHFDLSMKGYRYFEVLYDGKISILAYRKVILDTTSPYHDKNGILKNMAYKLQYQYYFYSPEKGYTNVKLNKSRFLSKFEKPAQKPVKKILRKNRIRIEDEHSFVQAWFTVEKEGYRINF